MNASCLPLFILCLVSLSACLEEVSQRPSKKISADATLDDSVDSTDGSVDSMDGSVDSMDGSADSSDASLDETSLPTCESLNTQSIYVDADALNDVAREPCNVVTDNTTTKSSALCTKNSPCKSFSSVFGNLGRFSRIRSTVYIKTGNYPITKPIAIDLTKLRFKPAPERLLIVGTNNDWMPDPGSIATISLSPDATNANTTLQIIGNGSTSLTLQNLKIEGPDLSEVSPEPSAKHGRIAYTVRASNFTPGASLALENVTIVGGVGGVGPNGKDGVDGGAGGDATGSMRGKLCDQVTGFGGDGGDGGVCAPVVAPFPGSSGTGNAGVGLGGLGGTNDCNPEGACNVKKGGFGEGGMTGSSAEQGELVQTSGEFSLTSEGDVQWNVETHTYGSPAEKGGSGGGGGGGGAGSDGKGLNGGPGGGGGCAGGSAEHGHPGGASVALVLNNVALTQNKFSITYGVGGDGGDGGNAGKGGQGGMGHAPTQFPPGTCKAAGGAGGNGGNGGNGAPGFGGCPGVTIGVLTTNVSAISGLTTTDPSTRAEPGLNGTTTDGNQTTENCSIPNVSKQAFSTN